MNIKVIAFDADDTLWVNEPYFQETEQKFCQLLNQYASASEISQKFLAAQVKNLPLYGYGIKGYILSMIETALDISFHEVSPGILDQVISFGKELTGRPIQLLEGITNLLQALKPDYALVLATKGDLLDQERKLKKSGISHFFDHIEIMSEKKENDYRRLIRRLGVYPDEFMMIGNSLKSDVLPVLAIGGFSVHVPYPVTWEYEKVEQNIEHNNFLQLTKISELLPHLGARNLHAVA